MKSKLYIKERVPNKDREFGEAEYYYPVKIELSDGAVEMALFTENQIITALKRALTNEEDFPEKTLLEKLEGWFEL
jgi:hypothetical protein